MKRFLFALVLFTTAAFSANVILYDPASSGVTNRVIAYLGSVEPTLYTSNALMNPAIPGIGFASDWKVSNSLVVLLSAADQSAITNYVFTNNLASSKLSAFNLYTADLTPQQHAIKAAVDTIVELTVQQLNTLRTQPTNIFSALTVTQVSNTFLTTYSNKIAALTR